MSKFPNITEDIIESAIADTEDYHYQEARSENKNGRKYPLMTTSELFAEISDSLL